jgi:hypothetical protein
MEQACSLVDPFCPAARGAKYVDDSNLRTLTFTVQQDQVVSADANGNLAFYVVPQINWNPITLGTVTINTDIITAGFQTAPVVPILTGAASYRIVTMGYRLKNVAPPLTSSGMINLRTYSNKDGLGLINVINGRSYTASCIRNVALSDMHNELVVVPHTNQMPQVFYDPVAQSPSNLINSWLAPGFCFGTVFGSGLPAGIACIHVEVLMNIEYQFDDGAALGLAATPSPPFNSAVRDAAAHTTSNAQLVFNKSAESLRDWTIKHVSTYLRTKMASTPRGLIALEAYDAASTLLTDY